MSTCSKQNISTRWRSALTITVGCVAGWSAVTSATAQKSEPPVLVASLSVSTIQPESILNSVREPPGHPAPQMIERTDWPIPVLHRKPTDAEAWEQFEADYQPETRSRSDRKSTRLNSSH